MGAHCSGIEGLGKVAASGATVADGWTDRTRPEWQWPAEADQEGECRKTSWSKWMMD